MPELLGPSVSRQCWLSGLVAAWPQVLAMMAASTSASLQDSTSPMATTTAAGVEDIGWDREGAAIDVGGLRHGPIALHPRHGRCLQFLEARADARRALFATTCRRACRPMPLRWRSHTSAKYTVETASYG